MDMAEENALSKFIEDFIYLKKTNDEPGLEALMKEASGLLVTVSDVGMAIFDYAETIANYSDVAQAITEARLKAIVECLPEDIQEEIHKKFEEAEDELFLAEGEEFQ